MAINKQVAQRYFLTHEASRLKGAVSNSETALHHLQRIQQLIDSGENPSLVLEVEIAKWQERHLAIQTRLNDLIIEAGK